MRRGGGKQKGKAYTKKVAKILSKAFWGRDDYLHETHGSGSLSKHKASYWTGDIAPLTDVPFPLHVEVKKGYGAWDLIKILRVYKRPHTFLDFWFQCLRDRTNKKRQPYLLLVVGKDNDTDYAVFSKKVFSLLKRKKDLNYIKVVKWYRRKKYTFYVCLLEKFLERFSIRNRVTGG